MESLNLSKTRNHFDTIFRPLLYGYRNYQRECERKLTAYFVDDSRDSEITKGDAALLAGNCRRCQVQARRLEGLGAEYKRAADKYDVLSRRAFDQKRPRYRRSNHNSRRALGHQFSSTFELNSSSSDSKPYNNRPANRLRRTNLSSVKQKSHSLLDLSQNRPRNRFPTSRLFSAVSASLLRLNGHSNNKLETEQTDASVISSLRTLMCSMEKDMAALMGRFHFEVKAIIGFARLAAGDVFEVVIKHGAQRWKTRGKTQADRTQLWDQPSVTLNCQPDAPIYVKVVEVKFFKSKCLNERNFDATKFFAPQPQLVTMNLNTFGSIKLQLIVTWIPLLASKSTLESKTVKLENSITKISQSMGNIHSSSANGISAVTHTKMNSSAAQLMNSGPSLSNNAKRMKEGRSKSIDVAATLLEDNEEAGEAENIMSQSAHQNEAGASPSLSTSSPPKVCLREKKRDRERRTGPSSAAVKSVYESVLGIGQPLDKDRWRHSSTTILDLLYKDLSKSIPTLDELSMISASAIRHKSAESESYVDNTNADNGQSRLIKRNFSSAAQPLVVSSATSDMLKPPLSASTSFASKLINSRANISGMKPWGMSASMANLPAGPSSTDEDDASSNDAASKSNIAQIIGSSSPSKANGIASPSKLTMGSIGQSSTGSFSTGGMKKTKLSSLKRSRHNQQQTSSINIDYYARVPIATMSIPESPIAPLGPESCENGCGSSQSQQQRPFSTICNVDTDDDSIAAAAALAASGIAKGDGNGGGNSSPKSILRRQSATSSSFECKSSNDGDSFRLAPVTLRNGNHCVSAGQRSPTRELRATMDALRVANTLLERIETLRALLTRAQAAEFTELVGFEACMLNWEAVLKLNRAMLLEKRRNATQTNSAIDSLSRRGGGGGAAALRANHFAKRCSLFLPQSTPLPPASFGMSASTYGQQHSPSNASDELEAATALATGANVLTTSQLDQISENDSGIDSLRQYISPYNHGAGRNSGIGVCNHPLAKRTLSNGSCGFSNDMTTTAADANNNVAKNIANGSAQRRFKQFKERRKSLGVMLDSMMCEARQEDLQPHHHHQLATAVNGSLPPPPHSCSSSSTSSSSDLRRNSACASSTNFFLLSTASGHVEIDECLIHHMERAIRSLEAIGHIQSTPFEFTLTEMLYRMEQDTVALETLLRIVGQLPRLPTASNLLDELGATSATLRDIWIAACAAAGSVLVVPSTHLRRRLITFVTPIVEARYPRLVPNVIDAVMEFLCAISGRWPDVTRVTVFQFVTFFRNKHLSAFIENMSHEAWITSNLSTGSPTPIREVMTRLGNVPVVPPLESLRHIALVLARQCCSGESGTGAYGSSPSHHKMKKTGGDEVNGIAAGLAPIERYLRSASPELANDLAACYMCILEHEDVSSRCGACLALGILGQMNALNHLEFLMANDPSPQVRFEACRSITAIRVLSGDRRRLTESNGGGGNATTTEVEEADDTSGDDYMPPMKPRLPSHGSVGNLLITQRREEVTKI